MLLQLRCNWSKGHSIEKNTQYIVQKSGNKINLHKSSSLPNRNGYVTRLIYIWDEGIQKGQNNIFPDNDESKRILYQKNFK